MPGIPEDLQLVREVFDTCLRVNANDTVWIKSWDHTLDLAKAFVSECSLRNCSSLLSLRYEDVWLRTVKHGSKRRLQALSAQEEGALKESDYYIFTMGPRGPIPWSSIPEEKRREVSVWLDTRYDKSEYARRWARVAKAHKVKMLAIEATLATPERARPLGLNYQEWRRAMFRGCTANHRVIARRAKKLAKLMSGRGRVSVTSKAGTRLSFDLDDRSVGISDGISTDEMARSGKIVFLPAGAIETSVDEESAQGRIVFSAPVRLGNEMLENLALDLKDGRIVHHKATRGLEVFTQYLRRAGRDAGRFAFFGFGLNPNLRHGFTQDDKVLGGLTLGFGSNQSMGGKNLASDQWWTSLKGATVKIQDNALLDHGRLIA